jgi:hypothetical protein
MPIPLPPVVFGPITPITPEVRIGGVLPDAKVTVLANHGATQTTLGAATAKAPGDIWIALSQKPKAGWAVVAIQEIGGQTSEPSGQAVVVIDTPKVLAIPAIVSEINTCMADALADGLLPGATLVADIGGTHFAKTQATRTTQWIGLDQTKAIPAGAVLEIHQEAHVGGQLVKSAVATTLPIKSLKLEVLPPPVIAPPLEGCRTAVTVATATPGAVLKIDNVGMSEGTVNPTSSFTAQGLPLVQGALIASQRMPRCKLASKDAHYTVGPPTPPPAPLVQHSVCPQVACIVATQLVPGAILTVVRHVKVSPNGTQFGADHVFGIGHETETIYLGAKDMEPTDPLGPVTFTLYQTLCKISGASTEVAVAVPGGPFGKPKIIEPVYACARAVRVSGAHAGAWVQAFDGATKQPVTDIVVAPASDFLLKLWLPAVAGATILLRQIGCSADGDSPVVTVHKLPGKLPAPVVKAPVRPGTNAVELSGVLPGARVFVLVDGAVRAQMECWTDTPTVYLSGAPLQETQKLFAMQAMCDQWSPKEGQSVTVTKGGMKALVSPSGSIPRSVASSLTVTARDADTNALVPLGQVFIKGQLVATTGQTFSYTPAAGEQSPLQGEVHEDIGHTPAAFQIALTDPYWLVQNIAAPTKFYVDSSLEVNIEEATWILTPDWDPSLKKTVVKPATPPNIYIDTLMPPPAGGVKTITVQLQSLKCSTPGGWAFGQLFMPNTFTGIGDTLKIGYIGKKTKISWLIVIEPGYDQYGKLYITPHAKMAYITDY